jgi:hypothetical protein
MKFTAYVERYAPRDLFDLHALAERGLLTAHTVQLTKRLLGRHLVPQEFERVPDPEVWSTELAHQVADPGSPEEAFEAVRDALVQLYGW